VVGAVERLQFDVLVDRLREYDVEVSLEMLPFAGGALQHSFRVEEDHRKSVGVHDALPSIAARQPRTSCSDPVTQRAQWRRSGSPSTTCKPGAAAAIRESDLPDPRPYLSPEPVGRATSSVVPASDPFPP
jgi:hypothetical protein